MAKSIVHQENAPTAEHLHRLLIELYADQCGVKVKIKERTTEHDKVAD